MSEQFSHPTPLTPIEVAFGAAGKIMTLMPRWEEIPDEFRRGHTPWNETAREWFFSGLKDWPYQPRPDINHAVALAHLAAIQQSFEPQHEHKEASVAYLMSLWYEPTKLIAHEAKRKPRKPKPSAPVPKVPKAKSGPLKGGLGPAKNGGIFG